MAPPGQGLEAHDPAAGAAREQAGELQLREDRGQGHGGKVQVAGQRVLAGRDGREIDRDLRALRDEWDEPFARREAGRP